jgi:hypothetical protein
MSDGILSHHSFPLSGLLPLTEYVNYQKSYIFPSTTSTVYPPSFFTEVGEIVSR